MNSFEMRPPRTLLSPQCMIQLLMFCASNLQTSGRGNLYGEEHPVHQLHQPNHPRQGHPAAALTRLRDGPRQPRHSNQLHLR